jgi:hypothetical protein
VLECLQVYYSCGLHGPKKSYLRKNNNSEYRHNGRPGWPLLFVGQERLKRDSYSVSVQKMPLGSERYLYFRINKLDSWHASNGSIRWPYGQFMLPVTTDEANPQFLWWRRGGSNSRPSHCERDALPAELRPPIEVEILYRQNEQP